MIYINKQKGQGDEFQDIGNEGQDLYKDAQHQHDHNHHMYEQGIMQCKSGLYKLSTILAQP